MPASPLAGAFRASRPALLAAALALPFAGAAFAEPAIVKSVNPGDGLYEVVVGNTPGRIYVAAAGERGKDNGAILALDPATLEVKQTIELGAEPAYGLGINNRTKTLYATQTRGGTVAAIDLATGKVVATIKQGDKAHVREAIVDEEANRVYVTVMGRRDQPSAIWIIDGATNTLAGTIGELKGGVTGVALDKKGNRLFATAMAGNEVLEIDLAGGKVAKSFPSGGKAPMNLAYDAEGDRLFVANQESGDLTVLSAKDGAVIATIPTGEGALGVDFDPKRNLVYVANRKAGFVTLIDAGELKVLANIVTGSMPNTVAIDEATGKAYVTNKIKSAPRPPRPEGTAAAAPGAAPAAPGAATPGAGAPSARPAPMIDPNGDTVTIVTP